MLKECIVITKDKEPVAIYSIRHFDAITFLSFEQKCKENAEKIEQEQKEKEKQLTDRILQLEQEIENLKHEIAVDRGEVE